MTVRPEAQRVADIQQRLALARRRTGTSLEALRTELQVQTDWQTWYRARPLPFLAAAFFVGFLLAKRN